VNCDYAVQKLLEKDLVIIAGRNENAVGKPLIYTTSKSFMDYFGINTTDDLPRINEVLMEEMVQATIVNTEPTADEEEQDNEATTELAVTESGEIIEKNIADEDKPGEITAGENDAVEEDKQGKNEDDQSES
jgi:segregation and condensation protein B